MLPLKRDENGELLPIRNDCKDTVITPEELIKFFKFGFSKYERVWKTVLLLMLGARIRISEALAVNIQDFENLTCRSLNVRIQKKKCNVIVKKEIPEAIACYVREWILLNIDRIEFKDGFIFPSTNSRNSHHTAEQLQDWLCKKRKQLAKEYPEQFGFMLKTMGIRKYKHKNMGGTTEPIYAFSSHMMKRFAGTFIYCLTKDPMLTKEMLSHDNLKTTYSYYIDKTTLRCKEKETINRLFDINFYEAIKHETELVPAVFESLAKK